MNQEIFIGNRQRTAKVNTRALRLLVQSALAQLPVKPSCDLAFSLVADAEMARINEKYMRHHGSTDVITLDYAFDAAEPRSPCGEVFICIDVALAQARRYSTTWQKELARYVVHSLLHLSGYDDLRVASRRKMKREENRVLRVLARQLDFSTLGTQLRAG